MGALCFIVTAKNRFDREEGERHEERVIERVGRDVERKRQTNSHAY